MADKKSPVAFGTQFRGYRKRDVNNYIEQRAKEFTRVEDQLRENNRRLNDDLTALTQENDRLSRMLSESDRVITQQKEQIDALTDQLSESIAALKTLSAEVEDLEQRIATVAQTPASEPVPKTTPEPEPRHTPAQNTHEQKHAEKQDDDINLSAALKTIKNKILKFLK